MVHVMRASPALALLRGIAELQTQRLRRLRLHLAPLQRKALTVMLLRIAD